MKPIWKKLRFPALALLAAGLSLLFWPNQGVDVFRFTGQNLLNFLVLLLPVFVCVGLLDVWIPKEKMMALMGERSGARGLLLAALTGMVTAVPFYALLPIAGVLLKKNCRFLNVLLFLFSSTAVRVPLLLFEASSFGWLFTALRFALNAAGVLLISLLLDRLLTSRDKREIYERVEGP